MPFEDNRFDLIMAESVTVFTDTSKSLPEYYRVLITEVSCWTGNCCWISRCRSSLKELLEFFGIPNLMMREEWEKSLLSCGFKQAEYLEYNHFNEQLKEEQTRHLDAFEQRDKGLLFDAALWETLFKHDRMILDNTDYLASALFRAVK